MAAKVLYTQKGTDAAAIKWPQVGPASDQFTFNNGVAATVPGLIGYGDGTITYPDGRIFPPISGQGSTFVAQKS